MIRKVYIASPYTKGDVARNVWAQIDMADKLMTNGFVPFVPLLTHFQHMVHPRPYEEWMQLDFAWIEACDCVLRLDGESDGADREVQYAITIGKPVFYSYEGLILKTLDQKRDGYLQPERTAESRSL